MCAYGHKDKWRLSILECCTRALTVFTYEHKADARTQEQKEEPEKDENGYYIGQQCRVRWKSINGAYYNCRIRERNETAPTLTYAIDYADGDKDDSVDLERLTLDEWEKDDGLYC